ncbi:hypothetical protein [Streptomyces sp. NPDC002133]|uniref:hypothetical protein n=1 Tax=Streptomyces sp. NPDC002133 TaxID=3154409 RepID=UPI00332E2827
MPQRIMYVQLKTGYDTDRGPSWIARVRFSKTWKTAYFHGRTLRRWPGMFDANFSDVETEEQFWISGPKRDQSDGRYSRALPEVDEDARDAYEAFLQGARLPGREHG